MERLDGYVVGVPECKVRIHKRNKIHEWKKATLLDYATWNAMKQISEIHQCIKCGIHRISFGTSHLGSLHIGSRKNPFYAYYRLTDKDGNLLDINVVKEE